MNLFRRLPLSQLLIVSFLTIVLGFLSVNIFTYLNINKLVATADIQSHTIEVLEQLEHILADLSDAETGQRGYLLTGKLKYLEPYNFGISNVSESIKVTRELTADNPNQQKRIITLEKLVEEKRAELQETVNLRAEGKSEEAINIVLSDKGKNIMDNIRVVIKDMQNEENSLLAVRKAEVADSEKVTTRAIIFGSTAGLLAAVYIALVISGFIRKAVAKIRYAASEIARGNMDVKVDTSGSNEIADVSRAIETMRQNLKKSFSDIQERTKQLDNQLQETNKAKKATQNTLEDVEKEKNRVIEEKAKVETILTSIGDGVFVVDTNLKVLVFNKVAEEISGYTAKEVIGRKYEDTLKFVFEKDGQPNDRFIKETITAGEPRPMKNHTLLIRKDDSTVPVADSAAPLKDNTGNVIGCVVVFRDVTKEREVDKAKTEFVSLASHQLRTPLSAINWYAEILIAGDAGKLSAEQKKYLNEIYQGNQRMVSLVNALLNTSRIDLGTFAVEPEPISFVEIADSVIKELTPQIEQKKQRLTKEYDKDVPTTIEADPKLVRIVFQNLLSNAVKYTPDEGTVTLKLDKQDSNLLIRIIDTGYGIPKKQQPEIFQKLFRADNVREKDTEGTGLGLYIVRAIVEKSGGTIRFESEENKGTTFFVTIPLSGMKRKKGTKGLSSDGSGNT